MLANASSPHRSPLNHKPPPAITHTTGDVLGLRQWLSAGGDADSRTAPCGCTGRPLHHAARHGKFGCIQVCRQLAARSWTETLPPCPQEPVLLPFDHHLDAPAVGCHCTALSVLRIQLASPQACCRAVAPAAGTARCRRRHRRAIPRGNAAPRGTLAIPAGCHVPTSAEARDGKICSGV